MADNSDLAKIAHDLRTPLTALKMAADLLVARRGGMAPGEEQIFASFHRNIDRIERIAAQLQAIAEQSRGSQQQSST